MPLFPASLEMGLETLDWSPGMVSLTATKEVCYNPFKEPFSVLVLVKKKENTYGKTAARI